MILWQLVKNIGEVIGLGYRYEFTWLIRLPVDELPEDPTPQMENNGILWKRSGGNIILGFIRHGHKYTYPVGLEALIVTKNETVIGYGRIVKSEIYELPDHRLTTVVEFSVTRLFDDEEKRIITRIFREMYGEQKAHAMD
ncbi:MAG: hypothetical protein GX039_02640 [Clostridia bacterium]|nr:hypothetical protein [Clostridia bacterium]